MNKTLAELQKALTTAGDGANLANIPDFDMTLHEELLSQQPLTALMSILQAEGLTHEFRAKTSHPMGWFEGEGTQSDNQNGAYTRKSVQLKIQRIWGSVTGFARAVDKKFIDALATEIEGSVEGMSNLMEYSIMWGAANDLGFTGDAYQYSGIIPNLFKYAPGNIVDAGGDKIALADLDLALYKASNYRQLRNDPRLWLMGQQMKQVTDGLQTKVSLPLSSVELADGQITMAAYGKAGILESDFIVPAAVSTSPAVTAAQGDDSGTLAAGSYTYQISSVTIYGEQVVGTASDAVTADATHTKIDLSWTADANAKLYFIWRKLGTGAFQLLDIIAAKTYDASGKVNGSVATYSDTGARAVVAIKPLQTGEQNILLMNTNPNRGAALVGMVDDMGSRTNGLLSFVELARTKDSFDYFLKSYHTMRILYPNVFSLVRHAKLS